ncbi:hypothetical protein [uncultured Cellulomonas sp.]|uniref:hypothetical protein n=1 Tax=uncultured Cellulomonas sp. TaxID=189682 RepID=UPI0028E72596|nr:hypothetical protein [uncultured Cellulomonas sp.]
MSGATLEVTPTEDGRRVQVGARMNGAGTLSIGRVGRVVALVAAGALVLAAAPAASSAAAPDTAPEGSAEQLGSTSRGLTYPRPTELGGPGMGTDYTPVAVTDSGVVVGGAIHEGSMSAFRWRDGLTEVLTGYSWSQPWAVNEAGQVLLNVSVDNASRPFVWEVDGEAVDILGPGRSGGAGGINDHGVAAVTIVPSGVGEVESVATWDDGVLRTLSSPGVPSSSATGDAINNRGEVAGSTWVDGLPRAVVWRDGAVTALELPGGSGSIGLSINERGQVLVALLDDRFGVWEADGRFRELSAGFTPIELDDRGVVTGFLRSPPMTGNPVPAVAHDRGVVRLPAFSGGIGEPLGTSDRGIHVGWTGRTGDPVIRPTAWLWGLPVRLGTSLSSAEGPFSGGRAIDVNRHGLVVGYLIYDDGGYTGQQHAVLWDLRPKH